MRTTCVIILWHPDHGFAFQFRDGNAPDYPFHWASFGGGIDDGETNEEGMFRELEEELGLTRKDIDCVKYIGTDTWETDTQHIFVLRMTGSIDKINLQEGAGIGWFRSLAEIPQLRWGFNFPEMISRLFEQLADPAVFFSNERTEQDS